MGVFIVVYRVYEACSRVLCFDRRRWFEIDLVVNRALTNRECLLLFLHKTARFGTIANAERNLYIDSIIRNGINTAHPTSSSQQ